MTASPPTRPPGPAPVYFPLPWASDWGEDRHGPWQALTYRGARQAFRWIPPTPEPFLMGSPPDEPERFDDERQHEVLLTQGFWLAETACTQALWRAVMGVNPSRFQGDDRPVETVSWDDCQTFIERLNGVLEAATGRYIEGPGPARAAGWDGVGTAAGPAGAADPPRLRLPTEAQWEYACRAATTGPFSCGANVTPERANYDGNHPYRGGAKGLYRKETVPVASLPPNPWGFYELHGNVLEWCEDWYGEYPRGPISDPVGPDACDRRVLRGGSWFGDARRLRSAYRHVHDPVYRNANTGLRLALGPDLGQVAGKRRRPQRAGSERTARWGGRQGAPTSCVLAPTPQRCSRSDAPASECRRDAPASSAVSRVSIANVPGGANARAARAVAVGIGGPAGEVTDRPPVHADQRLHCPDA